MNKMNEGRLAGKVAVITGSTSGIGEAIARRFAIEGAKVVIAGRRAEKGENISAQIRESGAESFFIQTDVTKDDQIRRMIETAVEIYGSLDILVNNAGTFLHKSFSNTTSEDWDHYIALDARSYFICMKTALPYMEKQGCGSIINVSSLFALKAMAGFSLYAFVKAGLTHMSRVAALEYADKGIRINCLIPGATLTEMTADQPDNDEIAAQIPMGRHSTPEEQAYAAVYLASDESKYATGATFVVDGGWYPAW